MKIGFISSTPRFSQLRHSRLIESLKPFGVQAEFYTPFEDYTHIVVESGALVEPLVPVLEKYKERGTKVVLHLTESTCPRGASVLDAIVCMDKSVLAPQFLRHKEFRKTKTFQVEDGVAYHAPKPSPKKIKKLVWFGNSEDVGTLTTIEPFLMAATAKNMTLTVLVDDPSRVDSTCIPLEVKPFSDDLSPYDMAILPCGNPWAIKTAWMWNLPAIYEDLDDLYQTVAYPNDAEALCRGVQKKSDWLDFLQLHEISGAMYENFRAQARKHIMIHGLIQNCCAEWVQVLESL